MAGRSQHYKVTDENASHLNESLLKPSPDIVGVETKSTKKSTSSRTTTYLIVSLVILAIVTGVIILALAITLGVRTTQLRNASSSSQPSGSTSDNNTCLTPGCIDLAARVQASLNESADPCQDFYQFTCGNWVQNNIIPEGTFRYGVFTEEIVRDTLSVRLRKILESGNDGGVEAVGKALRLYQSCINNTAVDSLGAAPLLDVIRTQTGGWPLIGIPEEGPWSINSSYFFYENVHGGSALFNIFFFFDFVSVDYTYYIPYIRDDSSFLLKPGEDYDDVKSSLVDLLTLLNPSINPSVYEEAVERALNLSEKIQNIAVEAPNVINGAIAYNTSYYYSLERLQTLFPEFDWRAYFEYIYNEGGLSLPNDFKAIAPIPEYLSELYDILQDVTDKSVIRDYSKLLFVKAASQYLGGPFAEYRDATATQPGSAASCIAFVQDLLPIALARPYVEQYVPEGTRENISMLADFLVQGFGERVREMNWLSDFSKQATLEKVNAITSMVAYPADLFNNDYVNGLYSTFTADARDFFGNKLRGMDLQLSMRIGFTTGYDTSQWITLDIPQPPPTELNAVYNQLLNHFYVSAAILTPPFFRADWPEYFNFGALGVVVGHEITHGFDHNGQMRDKDGVFRMWWSEESQAEFDRRTPCFIDQYNQYSYLGIPVNGMGTLTENMADNGGLHTAFQGYRMRVEETGKEPQRLPALPYTPDQLFFIAYGQIWCEVATPLFYVYQHRFDIHAPAIARVNAVVNIKEFAEAFNCPVGTPMNPADKCLIW